MTEKINTNLLDQKFYLRFSKEGIKKNEMSICTDELSFLDFPFPVNSLTSEQIVNVIAGYVLTEEQDRLRHQMMRQVPVRKEFIHALFAFHILKAGQEADYRNDRLKVLAKTNNMPLFEFVSMPGKDNLFFVMSYDMSDLSLSCIEAHPSKPLLYKRVTLDVKQVVRATWQGPSVPIINYDELFEADDEEFERRMREIESEGALNQMEADNTMSHQEREEREAMNGFFDTFDEF